jgi:hypothetical protein
MLQTLRDDYVPNWSFELPGLDAAPEGEQAGKEEENGFRVVM